MRTVHKVRVFSKNFVTDFFQNLKNIVGGRLKAYEKMIEQAIDESISDLLREHPLVKNLKMQVTEMTDGSIAVIVYGEVK